MPVLGRGNLMQKQTGKLQKPKTPVDTVSISSKDDGDNKSPSFIRRGYNSDLVQPPPPSARRKQTRVAMEERPLFTEAGKGLSPLKRKGVQ